MKTERLGNLEHFFECVGKKGSYKLLTGLPRLVDLAGWLRELEEGQMLALYWNNPYGLHAICEGNFAQQTDKEAELSKIRMDMLIEMLRHSDDEFADVRAKWYYPYPAVEFPVALFSDARLPEIGECDDNRYNFRDASLELFDEREAADRLIKTGQYIFFAHAYMVVLSKDAAGLEMLPDYTRYSNERREEMQIRTDLYKDKVIKSAFSHQAKPHIISLEELETKLTTALDGMSVFGRPLAVNSVRSMNKVDGIAELELFEGQTMEKMLDRMVENGEAAKAVELLLGFAARLRALPQLVPFESSYEFRRWFGDIRPEMITLTDESGRDLPIMSLPATDIDMIPQNILLDEKKAVLIDYEWSFTFPVPVDYVIFRCLYYFLEGKHRLMYKQPGLDELYEKAGFKDNVRQNFLIMETHFQEYVQQAAAVLRNEYDMYGKPLIKRWQIQAMVLNAGGHEITVTYPSHHEETISSIPAERGREEGSGSRQEVYHYKIPVNESGELILQLPEVRLLRIGILAVVGGRSREQEFLSNGELLAGCVYSFENVIPKLSLDVSTNQCNYLMLSLEEIPASADAFGEIRSAITDYKFLAENRDKQLEALKSSTSWKLTKPLRSLRGDKQ